MGYTLSWGYALENGVTNGTETTICEPACVLCGSVRASEHLRVSLRWMLLLAVLVKSQAQLSHARVKFLIAEPWEMETRRK
jgi:hypothetical protein